MPVFPQNIPRLNPLQSKFLYLIELESRIQQSVKKEKKKYVEMEKVYRIRARDEPVETQFAYSIPSLVRKFDRSTGGWAIQTKMQLVID